MFGEKKQKDPAGHGRRSDLRFFAGITAVFLLFCLSASWWQGRQVIPEGVKVAGIPLAGLPPEEAAVFLSHRLGHLLERRVELVDNDFVFGFIPCEWGFYLDYPELVAEAFAQGRAGSLFRRWRQRGELRRRPADLLPAVKIKPGLAEEFLGYIEKQINVEPVSADLQVDREGRIEVIPGRPGRRFQRQGFFATLSRVILAEDDRSLTLPVTEVEPALSGEKIKEWGLTRVLTCFSTRFNPQEEDRVQNIRTAASALHGAVVFPGQELSFNRRVGPRAPEKGYREAPVLYEGELIPGIGGGVCQVSTTLYNAWLLAGLPVIKRFNHTMPVSYVGMGRDAAVVDGGQDLVVANSLSTPIFISARIEADLLTVAVVGRQEDPRVTTYLLETEVVQRIPPPETRIEDPALAPGEELLAGTGREGYIVELWRLALDRTGQVIRREFINRSSYQPVARLLKTGIKTPPAREEPEGTGSEG
jgi:vancomycin resistance protein YoaR